jgi:enoyl-CoA hydratase
MEMALTGESILAKDVAQLGLVARLADPGKAVAVAIELAGPVGRIAPPAVAASKRLVEAALNLAESNDWSLQGELERTVFTSNDAQKGPRAFAERRAPRWIGSCRNSARRRELRIPKGVHRELNVRVPRCQWLMLVPLPTRQP